MTKQKPKRFIVLDVVERISVKDTLLKESSSEVVLELQTDDSLGPYTVLSNGRRSEKYVQPKIVKAIPLLMRLPIK